MSNDQLQTRSQTAITLKSLAESPAYKGRFNELLRERAPQFVASLVQLVNASPQLQRCDPHTVFAAAITAAAMNLPIEKNLGFAYIVPYGNQAQFQIGYRGLVQLAIRSAQYKFLNVTEVYEGELDFHNPLTSEITLKRENRKSDKIVGYAAYFRLVNGFEHAEYWDADTVEAHAKRYSQAYRSGKETPWQTDFDKMAKKTVLKSMLSHWGIMSIEMERAFVDDEKVRTSIDEEGFYPDAPTDVKTPQFPGPAPVTSTPAPAPAAYEAPAVPKRRGRPPQVVQPITEPPPPPVPKQPELPPTPPDDPFAPETAQELEGGVYTAPEPETEPVEPAAAVAPPVQHPAQVGVPVEPAELTGLRQAMTTAQVNERQVLGFCLEKKLHRPDGQPATALNQLAPQRLAQLGKNLSIPNSPVIGMVKQHPA